MLLLSDLASGFLRIRERLYFPDFPEDLVDTQMFTVVTYNPFVPVTQNPFSRIPRGVVINVSNSFSDKTNPQKETLNIISQRIAQTKDTFNLVLFGQDNILLST